MVELCSDDLRGGSNSLSIGTSARRRLDCFGVFVSARIFAFEVWTCGLSARRFSIKCCDSRTLPSRSEGILCDQGDRFACFCHFLVRGVLFFPPCLSNRVSPLAPAVTGAPTFCIDSINVVSVVFTPRFFSC
jgi:hypothetical protein